MRDDELDPQVALARWVLGDLPPERVPQWAIRALERGCEIPSVAVLAGMRMPTERDVEEELGAVLRETGLTRRRLPDSTREPAIWEQLRPFIGLASEWEDHEAGRRQYEADIVDTARELLGGGGLDVSRNDSGSAA